MSTKGWVRERWEYLPKGENSMAVPGLGCSVRARWAVLSMNGPRQQFPHIPLFKVNTFNNNNWDEPE